MKPYTKLSNHSSHNDIIRNKQDEENKYNHIKSIGQNKDSDDFELESSNDYVTIVTEFDNDEHEREQTQSDDKNIEHDELFGLNENSSNLTRLNILTKQSAPAIIAFFLGLGGSFINLLFAGRFVHANNERSVIFAGISLANMFANVTFFSLIIGMSSAVETLGSQYNGAKLYRKVGLVLQRSFAVLSILSIPLLCSWYFVYDIYKLLGVEEDVCLVIKDYLLIRLISAPMDIVNESYEKYLMSIGIKIHICGDRYNIYIIYSLYK